MQSQGNARFQELVLALCIAPAPDVSSGRTIIAVAHDVKPDPWFVVIIDCSFCDGSQDRMFMSSGRKKATLSYVNYQ
jgi:hypothetical protein